MEIFSVLNCWSQFSFCLLGIALCPLFGQERLAVGAIRSNIGGPTLSLLWFQVSTPALP